MGGFDTYNMSMSRFALFVTLVSVAAALPSDFVSPEDSTDLMQVLRTTSGQSPEDTARRTYELLQQGGNNDNACRALANSMLAAVNSSLTIAQNNINALDLGEDCPNTNAEAVAQAQQAHNAAQAAIPPLQEALTNATSNLVTLVKVFTPNPDVDYFTSDSAWTAAASAHRNAQEALTTAQGTAEETETALTAAQAAQTTAIHQCQCTAQSAYEQGASINAGHESNSVNDWNRANQLICVLDNTSPCNYASPPLATRPDLPAAVIEAVCTAAPTNAPTNPVAHPQPPPAAPKVCGGQWFTQRVSHPNGGMPSGTCCMFVLGPDASNSCACCVNGDHHVFPDVCSTSRRCN